MIELIGVIVLFVAQVAAFVAYFGKDRVPVQVGYLPGANDYDGAAQ